MKILKSIIFTLALVAMMFPIFVTWNILIPVNIKNDTRIEMCLGEVGVYGEHATEVANGIRIASSEHNLKPEFIIALTYTESTFNKYAKSSKNYRGYMQIPFPLYDSRENILIGSRIMREKLALANGDILKAICLYKGWGNNPPYQGIQQAKKVLALYNRLLNV